MGSAGITPARGARVGRSRGAGVTHARGAEVAQAGGTRDELPAQQMVLRLHELPQGFRVGDDSGCSSADTEGAEPAVAAWIERDRPLTCSFEYERLYALPGPGVVPPLVESTAIELPDEAAAAEGLRLAPTLSQERTGRDSAPSELPAPPVGTEARLFRSDDIGVEGRAGGDGSILYWRQGAVLSALLVAGGAPEFNDRVATRLAALQQKHVESPTPYTDAERDDSQVPLGDPRLKLPVYWLGARFSPGGGLPASTLAGSAVYTHRGEAPPGEKLEISYAPGPQLGTWTKASWARQRGTKLTRVNWTRSCSRPTRTELRRGDAVVFGVHLRRRSPSEFGAGPRRPAPCPGKPPNHYFAIAHLGRAVVGVDLTVCFTCAEPHAGPYDSLRAMKAVVRGLRPRSR